MISNKDTEWMIVDRWKTLLMGAPQSDYSLSQSYAALMAILAWVLQRIRPDTEDSSPATTAAFRVKEVLQQQSARDFYLAANVALPKCIQKDFSSFSALEFLIWVRDGLCHGDAHTVAPINTGPTLVGFEIKRQARRDTRERTLKLAHPMIADTGVALANLYCTALQSAEASQ